MKQLLPDLLFIRTKAVYTFVLFSSFFRDSVGRMVNLDAQIGKRFNKAERERLSFFFFFFFPNVLPDIFTDGVLL